MQLTCGIYLQDNLSQIKILDGKALKIIPKMPIFHNLQPKHTILKQKEADEILLKYNISLSQIPKIKITDPALPEGAGVGDVIKIERKDEETRKTNIYFRVVVM